VREEPNLSPISLDLAEGKNKQDDRAPFVIAGALNDFLVRRQLLTMERMRIQEVLLEAETRVKAEQDHLVALRDAVLASLRNHTSRLTLIESPKRRQKPKELLKTAERCIRKGLKQLAQPKTTSAEIADSSEARAQGLGHQLPKIRQLDGWQSWFGENDPAFRKASCFRKDRIQVALVAAGGLGDVLDSTILVRPVLDHFSCDLTIITAQPTVAQVVAHNPYVRHIVVPVTEHEFEFTDRLSHIPVFDLIIRWKYRVEYLIPPGSRIGQEDIRSLEANSSELRQTLEKYCYSLMWPKFNFALSRDMTRLGLSVAKVTALTSGLPHRNQNEIPFFPSKESLRVIGGLLTKPYVTVHHGFHGFNPNFLPARTRMTDYTSTKNISMQQWRQIVSLIRKQGVEVIQLGVVEEEKIEGVTHHLNGQTSLEETSLLIKYSLCHIDTEGGLVHLANAVHGRCVVLFGPTPVELFGYPDNINLEPSDCKACWFSTHTWVIECPRHTSGPECMSGHTATKVVEAANRIIAESHGFSAKLIEAETPSFPISLAETVAMAQTLLGQDAANRVLLILDDLPFDIDSALSGSVFDSSDVIICTTKPIELEPSARVTDRLEYGSLLNLPRPSSSIESAVFLSHELEWDIAPFALREIFRVLKPGGQLVFAAVGETAGLDLRRSLLAARIAFDEIEMPSAPVYFCSLRKSGARAEDVPPTSRSAILERSPERAHGHSDAADPRIALLEAENTRQISIVRDRFAERLKLADQAWSTVDDAVQRGFGGDGWIWISKSFANGYSTKFFIRGWQDASDSVIWSKGKKSLLILPLPELPSHEYTIELQLHLAVPETSASNPTIIGVRVEDEVIENLRLSTDDTILTIPISTKSSWFRGISLVEFHLGDEIGDGHSERQHGFMRMGVKRFRYRVLSRESRSPSKLGVEPLKRPRVRRR
jgi:ADP-heptose:LPS heptosyltransferase/SAM-dependent methyltransferase